VDKAIKTGDPLAITAIQDFSKVNEPDRLRFIRILNPETSGAISGQHIIRIWQSFPADRFGSIVMANRTDWDASVTRFGGDPMQIIPWAVENKYGAALEADIKSLAGDNLKRNSEFVDLRMQQMGLKGDSDKQLKQDEITQTRRAMQQIVWNVWSMRQSQKKLEATPVGSRHQELSADPFYRELGLGLEKVNFDPRKPPTNPEMLEVWKPLKEEWDSAQKEITAAGGSYPEIYEAVAEGNDEKLLHFSRVTPEAFAGEQRTLLQALLDRITRIDAMVKSGELDLLAFEPAVVRLTTGGGKWAAGFEAYIIELLRKKHSKNAEMIQTISTIAKFAPLLLAPLAGTGIGLILEAVAIGVSVAIASAEYKQASAQAEAARATPIPGTELLDRATADAAKSKAKAELIETSVLAIVAAVAGGIAGAAKLVDVVQMARLRGLLKDEALIARLLEKVPNKGQLYRIASKAGDVSKLEELIKTIPNPERLEAMLARTGGAPRLAKLLEKVPEVERLANMLEVAEGARLETMIERLGSVAEVENMLARQARGEAEGLMDANSMARMSKGTENLNAEWDRLTPQQRLDRALAELNAELDVQGVPRIRARLADSASSSGQWSSWQWSASVDPAVAADSAAGGSAQKLASTLYHEGRHAEQDFIVARLKAQEVESPAVLTYPKSEGGLGIPQEVANQAAARKLPADSPQGKLAQQMAKAGEQVPPSKYKAIIDKRYDAMVARDHAKFELSLAEGRGIAKTGDPHPWTPEIKDAKKWVREAEAAFDIAEKAYRGVPFEKDAFAVQEEFEKHLAAATRTP